MKSARMVLQTAAQPSGRGEKFNVAKRSQAALGSPLSWKSDRDVGRAGSTDFFKRYKASADRVTCRKTSSITSKRVTEIQVAERPPATDPPILLLEGDNYFVSSDGTARTLYSLNAFGARDGISIDESFDIANAQKRYTVRQSVISTIDDKGRRTGEERAVILGRALRSVDLFEINDGIFNGAGTGSITWESAIAMSLLFAGQPDLLKGDVIELGSGVGLGGILCGNCSELSASRNQWRSFTLTDFNTQVLDQCKRNVEQNHAGIVGLDVSRLDWYDYLKPSVATNSKKYDTIIACDCVYLYPDIKALIATLLALIRDENSQVHLFGPRNRSALQELIEALRDDGRLHVELQEIELARYRLSMDPITNHACVKINMDPGFEAVEECQLQSQYFSVFLHIRCRMKADKREDLDQPFDGID